MAYRDDTAEQHFQPYEPYQPAVSSAHIAAAVARSTGPANPPLNHRVSALTVFEESPYDPSPRPHLNGRESMVSLESYADATPPESDHNGHTYDPGSSWTGSFGYSGAGTYAPVTNFAAQPSRRQSRLNRSPGFGSSFQQPILEGNEEEEYGMSLLQSAAPMGGSKRYEPITEQVDIAPFDITGFGPMTSHDEDFMKKLQEQEASGTLTGGLGQGIQPDVRLRDEELLSSPVAVQRGLSRSFSRRPANKGLGRFESIRQRGQDEANRKGEVIEVIVEDRAATDLSSMEGPSTIGLDEVRRSTFPVKEVKREIFYPQPNWKPVTMRWPYLLILIVLSIGLAVIQELLFQQFHEKPILKFKQPDEVKPLLYFTIKFLPTVCAVAYGVFWQFTDFEVRRLEAFYQLSTEKGTLASKSINVDYVTSFSFLRPFRALKSGHYAVALSSVASTFAVSLVPTFAAASIVLTPSRSERLKDPEGDKEIFVAAIWSRLLTATLSLCAVLACGLLFVLQKRRSGLLSDVRGIAGLAAMAVVSHILMDFKDMDTAKHKDIHHKLKRRRYMLRNSSLAPYDGSNASKLQQDDSEQDDSAHLSENPHPMMLRTAGSIPFIFGLFLFAGCIPVFLFTPADIVTERAAWVVTALAVMLKMCWAGLETAVRMMEPYYILSKRHAPAKTLTLDYTALPFGYMPLRALMNGHILVFLVGFGSVMAEFLTILVTSLATVEGRGFIELNLDVDLDDLEEVAKNSGSETVLSFYVTLGLTLFILMYMTVVATIVFFRRRHPFLPRQPNTIASVLAFIHQSKMLYNFVGLAKLTNSQMSKKLDDGKTYGLGWFTGRDGRTHCGVDQEELTGFYKHGVDYTSVNNPWDRQWDVL